MKTKYNSNDVFPFEDEEVYNNLIFEISSVFQSEMPSGYDHKSEIIVLVTNKIEKMTGEKRIHPLNTRKVSILDRMIIIFDAIYARIGLLGMVIIFGIFSFSALYLLHRIVQYFS